MLCLSAALASQNSCTDEPVRVPEPGGVLFAAALFAWASPFVVSAVRRRGPVWWVVGALAVVVAVWWTVDLYANPLDYSCPG